MSDRASGSGTSSPLDGPVLVVGAGRMGTAIARAMDAAGLDVRGPAGRGATGAEAAVVILAVPDRDIAAAAALVTPGRLVGHLSGATALTALAPHEAFGLHPLTTVAAQTPAEAPATTAAEAFAGIPAAIAGSTARAQAAAEHLARTLRMEPFVLADADRAAYHAAAAIASNFLVTLEGFAADLASTAGVDRAALVPLVRTSVENWAAHGAASALTGPIARGDIDTVARHRDAVAARLPEHLALFDALATATQELAGRSGDVLTRGARSTTGGTPAPTAPTGSPAPATTEVTA